MIPCWLQLQRFSTPPETDVRRHRFKRYTINPNIYRQVSGISRTKSQHCHELCIKCKHVFGSSSRFVMIIALWLFLYQWTSKIISRQWTSKIISRKQMSREPAQGNDGCKFDIIVISCVFSVRAFGYCIYLTKQNVEEPLRNATFIYLFLCSKPVYGHTCTWTCLYTTVLIWMINQYT